MLTPDQIDMLTSMYGLEWGDYIEYMETEERAMTDKEFIEACYDLAYGDSKIARTFSFQAVLKVLRDYSDKSFAWETMLEEHQPDDDGEDTQEDYDLREKMETYLRSCTNG